MTTYRTRRAAAYAVKDQLTKNALNRSDIPAQLFIITNYRPGQRPTWSVTELTPSFGDKWYGPFRQANVKDLTENLGVEWEPILPAWVGAPVRGGVR